MDGWASHEGDLAEVGASVETEGQETILLGQNKGVEQESRTNATGPLVSACRRKAI
jgi:hypothetical protein